MSSSHLPSFSVVINTLNRARMLSRTLDSLRRQDYLGEFEVVVVNGPSTDDTLEVLADYEGLVRLHSVDVANLSVSRNAGIAAARGDVVVFLDDDAVPERAWLTELAAAYADPEVGAAGGFVFDHTGYAYQYRFAVANRLGVADLSPERAQPELCFPGSFTFPHLLGANSSFRRAALLAIGGFDEEFEYYLDETDVHVRVLDAGYVIAQVPRAVVHHSYAPSDIRGPNRVPRHRYSVMKNKLYFSLIHARGYFSMDELFAEHHRFVEQQRQEMTWAVSEGLLAQDDLVQFEADVARATEIGLARGLAGPQVPSVDVASDHGSDGDILQFATLRPLARRSVALISQEFPPSPGGIGRFVADMATELAAVGHDVHVITKSTAHSRVDYQDGVWIHRLDTAADIAEAPPEVPAHIWAWSETARREIERIDDAWSIDVVEAPVWDAQGVAFLGGPWPLVTSLQTTLRTWLDTHPVEANDPAWMAAFGTQELQTERRLMVGSDAVRAISAAIRDDVARDYDIEFPEDQVVVAHLGVADPENNVHGEAGRVSPNEKHISLLFVGRLEARKGVDILLAAFEEALTSHGSMVLNLIGDDSLPIGAGDATYRSLFEARDLSPELAEAVRFVGVVTEHQLGVAYDNSDVVIVPSRYESFGLTVVEAMAHSKPVIASRVGGMPEIVRDGKEGLLVEPEDVHGLAAAIRRVAGSRRLREGLGARGRATFEKTFTAAAMANRSIDVFDRAIERHRKSIGE